MGISFPWHKVIWLNRLSVLPLLGRWRQYPRCTVICNCGKCACIVIYTLKWPWYTIPSYITLINRKQFGNDIHTYLILPPDCSVMWLSILAGKCCKCSTTVGVISSPLRDQKIILLRFCFVRDLHTKEPIKIE